MIVRIVKMTFIPEKTDEFLVIFKANQKKIKAFPGCKHLELWQDRNMPHVYFTYSQWQTEEDLNSYRNSEFFENTWAKTKALFMEKAEAYSLNAL
jgi:heme-degrading monooxygenase HmoA